MADFADGGGEEGRGGAQVPGEPDGRRCGRHWRGRVDVEDGRDGGGRNRRNTGSGQRTRQSAQTVADEVG